MRGEYDGGMRILLMAGASLYILSPIDLLPEAFLTVFGLADDLVIAVWLASAVMDETMRFVTWERRSALPAPPVRR